MAAGVPLEVSELRLARARSGLSQAELAKAAGISTGFIAMLELGQRSASMKVVEALANAMEVNPRSLLQDPA